MEKEIKILELFGGIGALTQAFKRQNIPHKVVDYVEIDKYAVKSYNAMNGTNFEPQDICTWDRDIEVDLIMHGSPCQDFSSAGLQKSADYTLDENGNMIGNGTRSSLMYETIRIVKKIKPKYVIWENVRNLLSKKHRHNFDSYLETMEQLGYTNYYQVLNAKDYGIPQNRERVFTISILNNEKYDFPSKQALEKMPIDFLEEKINEKYYLSNKNLEWLKEHNKRHIEKGTGFIFRPKNPRTEIASTLRANASFAPTDNAFFEFPSSQKLKITLKDMLEKDVDEKYYLSDKMIEYISCTGTANFKNKDCKINLNIARPLTTDQNKRAGTTNYISEDLPKDFDLSELKDRAYLRDFGSRGKIQEKDYCDTLVASMGTGGGNVPIIKTEEETKIKIRRLTPKEAWRLMGFDDEAFEKASQVNSNSQLYKQAGNSIVVNVLEAIIKNLPM